MVKTCVATAWIISSSVITFYKTLRNFTLPIRNRLFLLLFYFIIIVIIIVNSAIISISDYFQLCFCDTFRKQNFNLLFSAHISYGKGKYLNQTVFFLQNLPRFYLYLNLRVLPIKFNPHKFSFVRYVFVEIFEVFFKK